MLIQKLISGTVSCAFALCLAGTHPDKASEVESRATVLEGDWVRVLDGCADLPMNQVLQLPETGGGNRVSRSQTLSFRGETYQARILPAPRCKAEEFQPTGPDIAAAPAECSGGLATGTIAVSGDHHLTLTASSNTGTNNWGAAFRTSTLISTTIKFSSFTEESPSATVPMPISGSISSARRGPRRTAS